MLRSFPKTILAASALALSVGAAQAATVEWTAYVESDINTARSDRALIELGSIDVAFENFERFAPVPDNGGAGDSTPLIGTNVGDFTTTPGATCGGSCDAPNNESLIRDASSFGRYNTTEASADFPNPKNWLDSNDNDAINLAASSDGEMFDIITLFLTDVDDVGPNTFSIIVGDLPAFDIAAQYSQATLPGNQTDPDNSDLFLISIVLDNAVSDINLSFNIDDGDGFGMDDVRLGLIDSPAPPPEVPLPAGVVLLLSGLGALGAAKARRKKS